MDEVVKHRLIPDIHHPPPFKRRPQTVRSKCSQCDCKETKHSCDAKKQDRHVVNSSDFAASQTPFSNRSGLIVGFGESF